MKESGFSILWPVKTQDYTVANFIYTHSFLCFLIGISFFWGLSSYGLLDINDGLYTSIARDMLENRQWTVPHLNSVPYLEKPPVLYYLLAGSFFLFGVNEFAARLPVVLSGLLVCMLAYWLGYRLNRKVCGFLAALILSSSPVFIIVSRTIYFDMVLTLMQSAAIILFYLYWKDKKLYLLRLAYIFLALAVMVKGFMSIAFLILIFTCFILLKRIHFSRVFIFFKDPVSIILFLIISVPWHVAAYIMQPDFFSFYIINENIYRFLGIREPYDYHTGPIWYYIPRWFLYYFPWSLSLPFFLLHFFKKIKIGDDTLFLIVWFTVLFIIFSISSNKGDYYLITASIPASLLLAQGIEYLIKQRKQYFFSVINIVTSCLFLILIFYTKFKCGSVENNFEYSAQFACNVANNHTLTWLLPLYIFLSLFAALIDFFKKSNISMIVLACALIPFVAGLNISAAEGYKTQAELGKALTARKDGRAIFLYGRYENISSLPFYINQRLVVVGEKSADLAFGQKWAAPGWFINQTELRERVEKAPAWIIIEREYLPIVEKLLKGIEYSRLDETARVLVLSVEGG